MASLVADYGDSSASESDSEIDCHKNNNFKVEEVKTEVIIKQERDEEFDEMSIKQEQDDDEDNEDDEYEQNEDQNSSKYNLITPKTEPASNNKLPLPTPDFNGVPQLKTSVFSNPFVEAEKAKSAILEKHVKMTPTLDDTKMINGKKICWNYRKGRCRFGHNCTFAHDSDLHKSAAELEAFRTPQETVICQTKYNGIVQEELEVDQENIQMQKKKKKRPGLSQTLVPGRKVLKMYKAQQAKTTISR